MLTTLVGGDVFEYISSNTNGGAGDTVRIALEGNIIVELIGVDVNSQNELEFGDVPGEFVNSATGRVVTDISGGGVFGEGAQVGGGRGGADGIEVIGPTPIIDPNAGLNIDFGAPPSYTIGFVDTGTNAINYQSLASRDNGGDGETWAINRGSRPVPNSLPNNNQTVNRTIVQLNQIDNETGDGTVHALLHQATLREDVMSLTSQTLDNVVGVALDDDRTRNPLGIMYAVNASEDMIDDPNDDDPTDGITQIPADKYNLFQVDRFNGQVVDLGELTLNGLTMRQVGGLTFDHNGILFVAQAPIDPDPTDEIFPPSTFAQLGVSGSSNNPIRSTASISESFGLISGSPNPGGSLEHMIVRGMDYRTVFDDDGDFVSGNFLITGFVPDVDGNGAPQPDGDHHLFYGTSAGTLFDLGTYTNNLAPDGLAFAKDINGQEIIVGLDAINARLVRMDVEILGDVLLNPNRQFQGNNPTNNMQFTALSQSNMVDRTRGLTSYLEPDDFNQNGRPLLYSISDTGEGVLRGSAVSLPVNENNRNSGASAITNILASDFRPSNDGPFGGHLYMATVGNFGAGQNNLEQLYTVNVDGRNRSEIQNSLVFHGDVNLAANNMTLTSIAWEQSPDAAANSQSFSTNNFPNGVPATSRLFGYSSGQNRGVIVEFTEIDDKTHLDPNDPTVSLGTPLRGTVVDRYSIRQSNNFNQQVTNIHGIEFAGDDPSRDEEFLYAVTAAGNNSELLRINHAQGLQFGFDTEFSLGPLPDPNDPGQQQGVNQPIAGTNVRGLAYNPTLLNPFTNQFGALIGVDANSDDFFFLDPRPRFSSADVFSMYIVQSDADASISVAIVEDYDDSEGPRHPQNLNREVEPFSDGVDFRVNPAGPGQPIVVGGDNGTGSVLLGARTEQRDNRPDEDQIPILSGRMDFQVGTRAEGVVDRILQNLPPSLGFLDTESVNTPGFNSGDNVAAGLVIAESLLDFLGTNDVTDMMGENFDDIQQLSVSRDGGFIAAVDTDGVAGAFNDRFGFFDPFNPFDPFDPFNPFGFTLPDPNEIGDQIGLLDGDGQVVSGNVYNVVDSLTGQPLSGIQGFDLGDVDLSINTGDAMIGTGEEMFAVYDVASVEPKPVVGQMLGVLEGKEVVATTLGSGNRAFAVYLENGRYFLVEANIDLSTGEVDPNQPILNEYGEIKARFGVSLVNVDNIHAMDANPQTGELFMVGTTVQTGQERVLFRFSPPDQPSNVDGFPGNDAVVAASANLRALNDVINTTRRVEGELREDIVGLAWSEDGNTLYAVRDHTTFSGENQHILNTVNITDGLLTEVNSLIQTLGGEDPLVVNSPVGADLVITTSDFDINLPINPFTNTQYFINLDSYLDGASNVAAETLIEIGDAIKEQTRGKVELVEIVDDFFGPQLKLMEVGVDSLPTGVFSITDAQGSTMATQLGINMVDNGFADNSSIPGTILGNNISFLSGVPLAMAQTTNLRGNGLIQAGGVDNAIIKGIDFDDNGGLFALDASPSLNVADTAQMLLLDLEDPSLSKVVAEANANLGQLENLTSTRTGDNFLAIGDLFGDTTTFLSTGKQLTLGKITLTEDSTLDFGDGLATFTAIAPLSGIDRVLGMSFSPGIGSTPNQQGLYVVDGDNLLREINYTVVGGSISALVTGQTAGTVTHSQDVMEGDIDDFSAGSYINPEDSTLDGMTNFDTKVVAFGEILTFDNTLSLSAAADRDIYMVSDAQVGQRLSVNVEVDPTKPPIDDDKNFFGDIPNLDPAVSIYDSTGALIVTNDDTVGDGVDLSATVSFEVAVQGDYFVVVQSGNGDGDFVAPTQLQDQATGGGVPFTQGSYMATISLGVSGPSTVLGGLNLDDSVEGEMAVGAFEIAGNGTGFIQDTHGGRLLDIRLGDLDEDGDGRPDAPAGTLGSNVVTTTGSLRPTVGDLSFDAVNNRFLASDNSISQLILTGGVGGPTEQNSIESAMLMQLTGFASDSAVAQDIGDFLWAGAITGAVDITGSVDRFYAGWLLTGNAKGLDTNEYRAFNDTPQQNFFVGGDMRNLVVLDSLGTNSANNGNPNYITGVDIQVGGKIGQIITYQDMIATINADNLSSAPFLSGDNLAFRELEDQHLQTRPANAQNPGDIFQADVLNGIGVESNQNAPDLDPFDRLEDFGVVRQDGTFLNDTFATAQRVGSLRTGVIGAVDVVLIEGTLNDSDNAQDAVDYFAVPLLADQEITFDFTHEFDSLDSEILQVGVFNPDGQLVHSTYMENARATDSFRFTTDRPGDWRFAVGFFNDLQFNSQPSRSIDGPVEYTLLIEGVGDLAIGGVVARGVIYGNSLDKSDILVGQGDLGSVSASTNILFDDGADGFNNFVTLDGSIRSIEAGQLGVRDNSNTFPVGTSAPGITIAGGDLGLVRSQSTMELTRVSVNGVNGRGGNIQVIDGIGSTLVGIQATGGLGILRAGDMAVSDELGETSRIFLDTDGVGFDGVISLIDVQGDFGEAFNGVEIDTGVGGNIHYLNVLGNIFQPRFFGGGVSVPVRHDPGQVVDFTDDGGGRFALRTVDTNGEATGPFDEFFLTTRTFAVVSGGTVLADVTSSGNVMISGATSNNGGEIHIGHLEMQGVAPAITLDLTTGLRTLQDFPDVDNNLGDDQHFAVNDISIDSADGTPINIFRIDAFEQGNPANQGAIADIRNRTTGEILNINAQSLGSIASAGSIGVADPTVGGALVARTPIFNGTLYPFNNQTYGVVISTDIGSITSQQSIGNIVIGASANGGQIDRIEANANGTNTSGRFEGIAGPILAVVSTNAQRAPFTGNILGVNIGEGILPSGTGNGAVAGIFAQGDIEAVSNSGNILGSDVRGNIIANRSIGSVRLHDASIVGASISVVTDFFQEANLTRFIGNSVTGFANTIESPDPEIRLIQLTGNGGILGSRIFGFDIGNISVGGFGIYNSVIASQGIGTIGNITVDGLGLREVI
ncbi:MAG: beta strand repeat-containing protein, partial [Planctomycetota bacterium]